MPVLEAGVKVKKKQTSHNVRNRTIGPVRPPKIQNSLRIRGV